ncbi:hypothetical protein IWZ00DRAFT_58138 [Phyllosticta capitalensis]
MDSATNAPHDLNHLNQETSVHQSSVTDGQTTSASQPSDASRPQSLFAGPMDPQPQNTFAGASTSLFASASEPTPYSFPPSTSLNPGPSASWNSTFDASHPGPSTPVASAEKSVDDPSVPPGYLNRNSNIRPDYDTPAHLSRMFSGAVSTSKMDSSHIRSSSANPAVPGPLPRHLLDRGLMEGLHSDITIVAFSKSYRLHRLILDQAPYFRSMLTGPWRESRSEQVELHPEKIDTCITERGFELTIKRLYGGDISQEEDAECLGLFATACWLDITDFVESSIDAILRQMHPDSLGPLIRLVTLQYYGSAGERLLASAKAMLCRDGAEMRTKNWDGIPGEVVREIVGGDGFYVRDEWERWSLAKSLLDRRLKKTAIELGLIVKGVKAIPVAPDALGLMAVRFDSVYRQNFITTVSRQDQALGMQQKWLSLYTHHEIEPLLVLLDEGIHYIHLDFEQLQLIRRSRDVFDLPVVSEKAITNALWQQMELRQRVVSAQSGDLELGLSHVADQNAANLAASMTASQLSTSSAKGKAPARDAAEMEEDEDMDSGSWDANGKPRKFWIPNNDCNIVVGASAEPMVSASLHSNSSRLSATLQPEDVQWANDFSAPPDANRVHTPLRSGANARDSSPQTRPKPITYTHFPPFRFAAEFPNPRLLKEKKRVYSRSVFYAGSLWNIYIQKVKTNKGNQLGVYLHRVKDTESARDGFNWSQYRPRTPAEEVAVYREYHRYLHGSSTARNSQRGMQAEQIATAMIGVGQGTEDDNASSSNGDGDAGLASSNQSRPPSLDETQERWQAYNLHRALRANQTDSEDDEEVERFRNPGDPKAMEGKRAFGAKVIPPYIDRRPTIKTYFKIYSPSKGGRLLSVYESAPDKFNFSQSWGWKSSTLMLDDAASVAGTENSGHGRPPPSSSAGFAQVPRPQPDMEAENGIAPVDAMDVDGAEAAAGSSRRSANWKERGVRKKGDGLLRFMVVIGNL